MPQVQIKDLDLDALADLSSWPDNLHDLIDRYPALVAQSEANLKRLEEAGVWLALPSKLLSLESSEYFSRLLRSLGTRPDRGASFPVLPESETLVVPTEVRLLETPGRFYARSYFALRGRRQALSKIPPIMPRTLFEPQELLAKVDKYPKIADEVEKRNIYLAYAGQKDSPLAVYLIQLAFHLLVKQLGQGGLGELSANAFSPLHRLLILFFMTRANIGRFAHGFEEVDDELFCGALNFLTVSANFPKVLELLSQVMRSFHHAGDGVVVRRACYLPSPLDQLLKMQASDKEQFPYRVVAEYRLQEAEREPFVPEGEVSAWFERMKQFYALCEELAQAEREYEENKELYNNTQLEGLGERIKAIQSRLSILRQGLPEELPETQAEFYKIYQQINPRHAIFARLRQQLKAIKHDKKTYDTFVTELSQQIRGEVANELARQQFEEHLVQSTRRKTADELDKSNQRAISLQHAIVSQQRKNQQLAEKLNNELVTSASQQQESVDSVVPNVAEDVCAQIAEEAQRLCQEREETRLYLNPTLHGTADLKEKEVTVEEHRKAVDLLKKRIALLPQLVKLLDEARVYKKKLGVAKEFLTLIEKFSSESVADLQKEEEDIFEANEMYAEFLSQLKLEELEEKLSQSQEEIESNVNKPLAALEEKIQARLGRIRALLEERAAELLPLCEAFFNRILHAKRRIGTLDKNEQTEQWQEELSRVNRELKAIEEQRKHAVLEKLQGVDWKNDLSEVVSKLLDCEERLRRLNIDLTVLDESSLELQQQEQAQKLHRDLQAPLSELRLCCVRWLKEMMPGAQAYRHLLRQVASIKQDFCEKPPTALYTASQQKKISEVDALRIQLNDIRQALNSVVKDAEMKNPAALFSGQAYCLSEKHVFWSFDQVAGFESAVRTYQGYIDSGLSVLLESKEVKDPSEFKEKLRQLLANIQAHPFSKSVKNSATLDYIRWLLKILKKVFARIGEPFDASLLLQLLGMDLLAIDPLVLKGQLTQALAARFMISAESFSPFLSKLIAALSQPVRIEHFMHYLKLLGCFLAAPELISKRVHRRFSECLMLASHKAIAFGKMIRESAKQAVPEANDRMPTDNETFVVNGDAAFYFSVATVLCRELLFYYRAHIPNHVLKNTVMFAVACMIAVNPYKYCEPLVSFLSTALVSSSVSAVPASAATMPTTDASESSAVSPSVRYKFSRRRTERHLEKQGMEEVQIENARKVMPRNLIDNTHLLGSVKEQWCKAFSFLFLYAPVPCYEELSSLLDSYVAAQNYLQQLTAIFYLLFGMRSDQMVRFSLPGELQKVCLHQGFAAVRGVGRAIAADSASEATGSALAPARLS